MNSQSNELYINWVLINELAVGAFPYKESHLSLLKDFQIKSLLTLCDPKEREIPQFFQKEFICKQYVLPDHRNKKIPTINQLKDCINLVEELLNNGPTYIHCFAGVERSPIVCIAYLIVSKNLDLQNALEYMMQIHPRTNPLKGQLEVLAKL